MPSPFDVPFRRCVACSNDCHAAYEVCPTCGASFATDEQRAKDKALVTELAEGKRREEAVGKAIEEKRDADAREANRSFEDLVLHEQQRELEQKRFVNDLLDLEPLRDHTHVKDDPAQLAEHAHDPEHRFDRKIDDIKRRRRALADQAPRQPAPPRVDPDASIRTGTVVAIIGMLLLLIWLGIGFRAVESGSSGKGGFVGLAGLVLVVAGVGWNLLRRDEE